VARSNLRNALSTLRKAIGDRHATPPFLPITQETIQFNTSSDVWIDVRTFTALLQPFNQQTIHPPGQAASELAIEPRYTEMTQQIVALGAPRH